MCDISEVKFWQSFCHTRLSCSLEIYLAFFLALTKTCVWMKAQNSSEGFYLQVLFVIVLGTNKIRYQDCVWIVCWQTSPYHSPTAADTAVHGWGTCHCNSRPIHTGRRSHPASRRLQDSKERHQCSTLEGHMPLLALDTWYLPASTGRDTGQDAWLLKQHKNQVKRGNSKS